LNGSPTEHGPGGPVPPASTTGTAGARVRRDRHTLLIVDDEPDVLDSLRYLFHRSFRVLTAEGGQAALEILASEDVHVILSDQRMPGMTGDTLLSFARRLYPDTIRMLFTGYADLDSVIKAVNDGHIFRYIVKPWDPIEIESIVRQAVEQYELLAERRRLVVDLRAANAQLTQANAKLSEASLLKSAFIEVASHEFNTPITLVLGLSELLLLRDPNRDPGERQIIEQISKGARQLSKLVTDTLKLMRSSDFERTLRHRPTELALLLHEAADKILPFVELRRLAFSIDIAPGLGTFEIDAPKVRDAVLNLLTNALKFTPDGGEFGLVAALNSMDEAEIVVYDRGIGLEPRALKRLFEPFFTEFDPSRHSSGDFGFEKRGLGLGLSIVRQFVELHGGRISAESTPGVGTRVTINLPRRPFPKPSFDVEFDVPEPEGPPDPPGPA
jgi:signal transduction histidine kinase